MEALIKVESSTRIHKLKAGVIPVHSRTVLHPAAFLTKLIPDGNKFPLGEIGFGKPYHESHLEKKKLCISDTLRDSTHNPLGNISAPIEDTASADLSTLSSLSSSTDAVSIGSDPSEEDRNGVTKNYLTSPSMKPRCPSPAASLYNTTGTVYVDPKESFTNTEVSNEDREIDKCGENVKMSNCCEVESRMTFVYRGSSGSDLSNESGPCSLINALYKPHKANDKRWEAIQAVRCRDGVLEFKQFNPLAKLGHGDIGTVYLAELNGTGTYFAMKFMDKEILTARKKLLKAETEREILRSLDHPFLPTLYTHFDSEKASCLVMEFCPGGDLHNLRQRQPGKYFPEHAVRFYVAEVLLALEYLHMLGIIYRDLKPENVLVREDGHIMLSDFDLSLRCAVLPTLVKNTIDLDTGSRSACLEPACVIQPDCIQPVCFGPRFFRRRGSREGKGKLKNEIINPTISLPELLAEPTAARSMSFVGTHEYLAPEIIKGEGHGGSVDWWTFGIFIYELLFGKTPFKGAGNRATLFNVISQPLKFPETPSISFAAKDLIRGLLVKEPEHRLAYRRGATEIKQHPFFHSVNWALIRCTSPPMVPNHSIHEFIRRANDQKVATSENALVAASKREGDYFNIDYF